MAPETTNSATPSAATAAMRAERDRFVALAFCWAEVLLELDTDGQVVFATGATPSLIGRRPNDLVGLPFANLVAPMDRPVVNDMLTVARKRGRVDNMTLRLNGVDGPTAPLACAGNWLKELGGHYFFAFRVGGIMRAKGESSLGARDEESGLYAGDAFADVVKRHLETRRDAGQATEDERMTLIALPGYDALRGRLSDQAESELVGTIGTCLRANSVDGDTASRIGEDRFGFVHRADLDIAHLQERIADFTREADPEKQGVTVESATVDVNGDSVSSEDIANGLIYTINRFRNMKGHDLTLRDLSTSISALAQQAVTTVNAFKATVADRAFQVVFQPIIDVRNGDVHHYEALARFSDTAAESPYEQITFAEETGLIADFDFAMAQKVVEWLNRTPRNSKSSVAVNVSGHSVGSLGYLTALDTLLNEHLWTRGRLMFEITESARMEDLDAANTFIQRLRSLGYQVCLDDFGAGAANFIYLSTLEVDIVKIDGSAIRNAQKAQKGKAFLKALVGLCRELGVATIAEMIDDDRAFGFVRDCGVEYVQGYLFGRPAADVKAFRKSVPAHLFGGRVLWQGSDERTGDSLAGRRSAG